MTYLTLMVHVDLGSSNKRLLGIAGDLAEHFQAGVIGIAACKNIELAYGDGFMTGDIIEADRKEIDEELTAAEVEFRKELQPRVASLEWRATIRYDSLSQYLACEARRADLVITGIASGDYFDSSRAVDVGDLLMRAGRPVLVVPASAEKLNLSNVLVGWKDTRETRRAVCDALPLLKKATRVTVAEIAVPDAVDAAKLRVADVVAWLATHGVKSKALVVPSAGDDISSLYNLVNEINAGLIVAGAYGHSRMREWVLGGVTRELLHSSSLCSLLSH
jgi:nucleotide-binding universal stress UspA family protein